MAGELAEQIGARIRDRRNELGLKQRQLADRIDTIARAEGQPVPIDNQRISDWERGVHRPSDRYMSLLAKALERHQGWFYGVDKTETPNLMSVSNGSGQLDRIEGLLRRLVIDAGHDPSIIIADFAAEVRAERQREDHPKHAQDGASPDSPDAATG